MTKPANKRSNSQAANTGLNAAAVAAARKRYGANVLPRDKAVSVIGILLSQLKSPLIYLIAGASAVSLALGEIGDFALIAAVVVVNVAMGFIQEFQAHRAYAALQTLVKPTATVIRDGRRQEIEASELVPGDLVILAAGEKIPADGKLIDALKLTVDEAILTGESEPVGKCAATSSSDTLEEPRPDICKVYMGTTVFTGRATMEITSIGAATELGRIAASLSGRAEPSTPLQVRLKAFSRTLTLIVAVISAAIFIFGLASGGAPLDTLRIAIILAVATVPEGLLIAVTVILVLGMRRILKRNGLVKRLLAVETLGSVTVICTDKTGTITEGRMRVERVEITDSGRAWRTMVLCNNLEGPVDVALWEYAEKSISTTMRSADDSPQGLVDRIERLDEELFSSSKKYMSVTVLDDSLHKSRVTYLKGAPEIVLGMCAISPATEKRYIELIDKWANEGLRLIGLAYRPGGTGGGNSAGNSYVWLGLIGMRDPVRDGVIDAIATARQAGIQVKLITGDYQRTAEYVARAVGLIEDRAPEAAHHALDSTAARFATATSLEGREIAALSDIELRRRVADTVVFSRVRPEDKLRIVQAMQENGEITAMIGDGVNDAPALQRANIGVVVGTASDVAKETADLVLLDSNFATVIAAIEEGRVIFANIRKVVAYALSNSFTEIVVIFTAIIAQLPIPLTVAQILWINLICDGPDDIMLGFEPKESEVMREKPRPLKAPILTRLSSVLIAAISIAGTIGPLLIFSQYANHDDVIRGQSIVFAALAVSSATYVFAYRNLNRSIFKSGSPFKNKVLAVTVTGCFLAVFAAFWIPGLRGLLGLVPLTLAEWGIVGAIALGQLVIVELTKFFANKFKRPE